MSDDWKKMKPEYEENELEKTGKCNIYNAQGNDGTTIFTTEATNPKEKNGPEDGKIEKVERFIHSFQFLDRKDAATNFVGQINFQPKSIIQIEN